MAVAIQVPIVVPGLHIPPTIENLEASTLAYNRLPDDCDQPQVEQCHLKALADLLQLYHVQDKFGIHLIHGHMKLEEGTVMLGKALTAVNGCWTKPAKIASIQASDIHGHIFTLAGNGKLQAYEYREGPITNLDGVDPAFFRDFIDYLQVNQLTTLLGLQILAKEVPDMMCEFVIEENGTVMLDAKDVKAWIPYRTTGYTASVPGITELKGQETHAKTVRETHQVFVGGAIGKEDALMDVLRAEDIIH